MFTENVGPKALLVFSYITKGVDSRLSMLGTNPFSQSGAQAV